MDNKRLEELKGMNKEELKAQLQEVVKASNDAAGEELEALVKEAKEINALLTEASNREKLAGIADQYKDNPGAEGKKGEEGEEPVNKERDERGGNIKAGKKVNFSAKSIAKVKNAITSEDAALATHASSTVSPAFNDVSSLVDLVTTVPLAGGESYKRGYVKSYGDGAGATAEGANYNLSEPTFGYAEISKEKVTAYVEEPEEMLKLPNADYDQIVEGAIRKALRRYMSRQILVGTDKFKGIFFNPEEPAKDIIDRTTDIELTSVDDGTLDEIIFSFGGEEDVEDVAVLILSKKDLKAMAKLRDKQGRKIYTIVHQGNTGTIDGVQYVLNSVCASVGDTQTEDAAYCMAYGPLSNYELALFSDVDAKKSVDYKFKQGQIAYRADVFAGGNVVAYNGFIRVVRPAAS